MASPLHHLCLLLPLSLLVRLPQDRAHQMLCDTAWEPAPGDPRPRPGQAAPPCLPGRVGATVPGRDACLPPVWVGKKGLGEGTLGRWPSPRRRWATRAAGAPLTMTMTYCDTFVPLLVREVEAQKGQGDVRVLG